MQIFRCWQISISISKLEEASLDVFVSSNKEFKFISSIFTQSIVTVMDAKQPNTSESNQTHHLSNLK